MTTLSIPPEYQKLSVKKAALLANVPRTSFIRKYLETGQISVQKGPDGTDFISFDELYRIFGETITQNLRLQLSGQLTGHGVQSENGKNEHVTIPDQNTSVIPVDSEKMHKLELELVRTQGERDRLEALLTEKARLLEERQVIIQEQKEQMRRYFDELQTTRRLLEDKTVKGDNTFQGIPQLVTQQEQIGSLERQLSSLSESVTKQSESRPKGFWSRLKYVFGN